MPPPCGHQEGQHTPDTNRLCFLWLHDERYRRLWGGDGNASPASGGRWGPTSDQVHLSPRTDCVHRGKKIGLRRCPSCRGHVELKTFQCLCPEVGGEITMQDCIKCPHFVSPEAKNYVRHLLVHCWPKRGGAWPENVAELKRRWHLFNGKKIVAIVTSPDAEKPETVIREFNDPDIEFIVRDNNPGLREVHTFQLLFEKVLINDPNHSVFYCHCKGVRGASKPWYFDWARMMYHINLDYLPLVEEALKTYSAAGIFKMTNVWWYAGTFFWLRCDKLCDRQDWRRIQQVWGGMESWIGGQFPPNEAAGLFHTVPWQDMYDMHYWQNHVMPDFKQFQAKYAAYKLPRSPEWGDDIPRPIFTPAGGIITKEGDVQIEAREKPVRHWIVDGKVPDELLAPILAQLPQSPDDGDWIVYNNDCERLKFARTKLTLAEEHLFRYLRSPEFLDWLRSLTEMADLCCDTDLYGAGIHLTKPGGYLQCHLDHALNPNGMERRLSLIAFLDNAWSEDWGGPLVFYDPTAKKRLSKIYPQKGRLAIWESSDLAYHGVEEVFQRDRVSAACYYLTRPRHGATRQRALFVPRRT
jgi:hypothetical protein